VHSIPNAKVEGVYPTHMANSIKMEINSEDESTPSVVMGQPASEQDTLAIEDGVEIVYQGQPLKKDYGAAEEIFIFAVNYAKDVSQDVLATIIVDKIRSANGSVVIDGEEVEPDQESVKEVLDKHHSQN